MLSDWKDVFTDNCIIGCVRDTRRAACRLDWCGPREEEPFGISWDSFSNKVLMHMVPPRCSLERDISLSLRLPARQRWSQLGTVTARSLLVNAAGRNGCKCLFVHRRRLLPVLTTCECGVWACLHIWSWVCCMCACNVYVYTGSIIKVMRIFGEK